MSGQLDAGPDWATSHVEQIREGMAWVGVTAQKLGIEGGSSPLIALQELKNADPVRYGPLVHPGDAFSYDIYSQAAQAVRKDPTRRARRSRPKQLIAVGQSQSAFYLTSYTDALAKTTKLFDGFLIQSRAGHAAPFNGKRRQRRPRRRRTHPHPISTCPCSYSPPRPDLFSLGYLTARQPDSAYFHDWEIAGGSHYDTYGLGIGQQDTGDGHADAALFNTMIKTVSSPYPGVVDCAKPINAGPVTYVAAPRVSVVEPLGPHRYATAAGAAPAGRRQLDERRSRSTPTASQAAGSAPRRSTRRSPRCRAWARPGTGSASSSAPPRRSPPRTWPRPTPPTPRS